jgi:ASC-1-like (ASCH) protein
MVHEWWVKRLVLTLFDQGKELEIRVKARFFENVRPGDSIVFNQEVRRRVIAVRRYSSFEEMLGKEDVQKILPGRSALETLSLLRQIYPFERERRGVYVFELAREAT